MAAISLIVWCIKRSKTTSKRFWKLYFTSHIGEDICFIVVWYGMVWYGMVWYGMVWYGMVWYGMVSGEARGRASRAGHE
jgi:hypothetical protein